MTGSERPSPRQAGPGGHRPPGAARRAWSRPLGADDRRTSGATLSTVADLGRFLRAASPATRALLQPATRGVPCTTVGARPQEQGLRLRPTGSSSTSPPATSGSATRATAPAGGDAYGDPEPGQGGRPRQRPLAAAVERAAHLGGRRPRHRPAATAASASPAPDRRPPAPNRRATARRCPPRPPTASRRRWRRWSGPTPPSTRGPPGQGRPSRGRHHSPCNGPTATPTPWCPFPGAAESGEDPDSPDRAAFGAIVEAAPCEVVVSGWPFDRVDWGGVCQSTVAACERSAAMPSTRPRSSLTSGAWSGTRGPPRRGRSIRTGRASAQRIATGMSAVAGLDHRRHPGAASRACREGGGRAGSGRGCWLARSRPSWAAWPRSAGPRPVAEDPLDQLEVGQVVLDVEDGDVGRWETGSAASAGCLSSWPSGPLDGGHRPGELDPECCPGSGC